MTGEAVRSFEMLQSSITCAILGPAGPQRSTIFDSLYKDERV